MRSRVSHDRRVTYAGQALVTYPPAGGCRRGLGREPAFRSTAQPSSDEALLWRSAETWSGQVAMCLHYCHTLDSLRRGPVRLRVRYRRSPRARCGRRSGRAGHRGPCGCLLPAVHPDTGSATRRPVVQGVPAPNHLKLGTKPGDRANPFAASSDVPQQGGFQSGREGCSHSMSFE